MAHQAGGMRGPSGSGVDPSMAPGRPIPPQGGAALGGGLGGYGGMVPVDPALLQLAYQQMQMQLQQPQLLAQQPLMPQMPQQPLPQQPLPQPLAAMPGEQELQQRQQLPLSEPPGLGAAGLTPAQLAQLRQTQPQLPTWSGGPLQGPAGAAAGGAVSTSCMAGALGARQQQQQAGRERAAPVPPQQRSPQPPQPPQQPRLQPQPQQQQQQQQVPAAAAAPRSNPLPSWDTPSFPHPAQRVKQLPREVELLLSDSAERLGKLTREYTARYSKLSADAEDLDKSVCDQQIGMDLLMATKEATRILGELQQVDAALRQMGAGEGAGRGARHDPQRTGPLAAPPPRVPPPTAVREAAATHPTPQSASPRAAGAPAPSAGGPSAAGPAAGHWMRRTQPGPSPAPAACGSPPPRSAWGTPAQGGRGRGIPIDQFRVPLTAGAPDQVPQQSLPGDADPAVAAEKGQSEADSAPDAAAAAAAGACDAQPVGTSLGQHAAEQAATSGATAGCGSPPPGAHAKHGPLLQLAGSAAGQPVHEPSVQPLGAE
eukprot:TRINITY_DN1159_c2_g2_i1.p1 TRINITY_DN1159_c2_g2~~TRINITY_DN1159_c2_g2_i1.p1  ORF type:complete len:540 (+),score=87.00 TRINITY_DN1159_c2_g2_i1:70-1689(+)